MSDEHVHLSFDIVSFLIDTPKTEVLLMQEKDKKKRKDMKQ